MIVVGTADPVGLTRLIRAIHELRAVVPSVNTRVVVNRVRSGSLGSSPADAVAEALDAVRRSRGRRPCCRSTWAPWTPRMSHGRSLAESAKSSKLRKALQQLAAGVLRDLAHVRV